ncbi:MAG: prolyl oligopeptidase family serine peptidase [Dehalococcoidia bacterium]|nr:prolyl oligopeptidase family serine peptidase [Dehalococcoidia bacterium]
MLKKPLLAENAPWKQRYRAPYITWSQMARREPSRGLVGSSQSGQYQLYAWDVPRNSLRQLTHHPGGTVFGSISPDGRWVYYLQDDGGNEIGHYVRIPWEGGEPQDITPGLSPYSAFGLNISRSGNLLASTIANDGFHVIAMPVEGDKIGASRELYHCPRITFGPMLSYDGKLGVVTSPEHTSFQHYSLVALETVSGRKIRELWEAGSALWPFGFSPLPGDYRFLAVSTRTGFSRPIFWNPQTGECTNLPLPDMEGDFSPLDWSGDGKHILLARSYQAVQHLAVYDIATRALRWLDHPGGYYGMGATFAPGGEIFMNWQDSTHPSRLIALDTVTGRKARTVLPSGEVPPGHPWKQIFYRSSDGQMIQGWLGLPDGPGPFPTILHMHGGPETATVEYFMPNSQAWLDHGFAFLAINYRGSTGFGRVFREKIWGDIGNWEVEDTVAAHNWLVREGIAGARRILLHGWSYGGYLTLLALGKHPDLWAGGMAGTATTDWAMEYEDLSAGLKGYSVVIFGGTPEEKPELYAAASPITYVENVKAPVLIIQGRNDTRTPARPVEVYEARMKALGKQVEVHWFDEGHFGGGVEQDIHHQEIMLKFAYRVLVEGRPS